MTIIFSKLALAELDEILEYIRKRSPLGVEHVETRFRRVLDHVSRHPEAAEEVAQRRGIRRLPLGRYPYVIYYEVIDGEVTILRILHGARRQPW